MKSAAGRAFLAAAAGAAACARGQVQETVVFNPINSNGLLGDPANGVGQQALAGGYALGRVNYSGTLTSVQSRTWATDARVLVTAPDSSTLTLQPFTSGTTFTTRTVSGSFFLNPGTDPAGPWTFRFYEIADDGGPAVVDARWNITFSTTTIPPAAPASTNLGTVVAPGPTLTGVNLAAFSVVWYRFTLQWPVSQGLGTYLDLDTFGTSFTTIPGYGINDTYLALYDSTGHRVAVDDDSGPGFTSQLSFGAGTRPGRPDGVPYDGRNGSLGAGTYYLAMGGYPLQPQAQYWGVNPTSALSGTMALTVRTNLTVAPPPCYANCDGSTTPPVLNVADFTCFLQKFAAGDAYANCDASTVAPVLNVADFTCFLQRFAAGCG